MTEKSKENINKDKREDELLTKLLTAMLNKLNKYDKLEVTKIINFKDIGVLRISDSIVKKKGLLTEQER